MVEYLSSSHHQPEYIRLCGVSCLLKLFRDSRMFAGLF